MAAPSVAGGGPGSAGPHSDAPLVAHDSPAGSARSHDRFRLDVFIHEVTELTVPVPSMPAVVLRLLSFPPLIVPRTRDDSRVATGDGAGNSCSFNRGKTCDFAAPAGALMAAAVQALPVTVVFMARGTAKVSGNRTALDAGSVVVDDGATTDRLVGTAAVDLSAVAVKVCTAGCTARGRYAATLVDLAGRFVGRISLECRMQRLSDGAALAAPAHVESDGAATCLPATPGGGQGTGDQRSTAAAQELALQKEQLDVVRRQLEVQQQLLEVQQQLRRTPPPAPQGAASPVDEHAAAAALKARLDADQVALQQQHEDDRAAADGRHFLCGKFYCPPPLFYHSQPPRSLAARAASNDAAAPAPAPAPALGHGALPASSSGGGRRAGDGLVIAGGSRNGVRQPDTGVVSRVNPPHVYSLRDRMDYGPPEAPPQGHGMLQLPAWTQPVPAGAAPRGRGDVGQQLPPSGYVVHAPRVVLCLCCGCTLCRLLTLVVVAQAPRCVAVRAVGTKATAGPQ